MLLAAIGTGIAHVSLPELALAFGATFHEVQWVVLAYLLGTTAMLVTVGSLGDRIGRRRLLLAGILLFTAATALCAIAPNLWALVAARAVQGVGAAIMMALALAMASQAASAGRLGRAMGIMASSSAIGTALGPAVGGLLLGLGGWRMMFVALVPTGVGLFLFARRQLAPEPAQARAASAPFDRQGAMLLTLSLLAYALALTLGRGSFGAANALLLLASVIGAGLFLAAQARARAPLIALARFRDRVVGSALLSNLIVSMVMMSAMVIGPFHLSRVFGLSPAQTGLAMAFGPSLVAILGAPAGHAADRLGGERATLSGLALVAGGSVAMALAPVRHGLPGYLVPMAVITIGYAMFMSANNMVIMSRVPRQESGVMAGTVNLSRFLGLISGASLMAAVFASAAGTDNLATANSAAIASGTRTSFALAAALVALVIVLAWRAWAGEATPAKETAATAVP